MSQNLPLPPAQKMSYTQWLNRLARLCDSPDADSDDIIDLAREIATDPILRAAARLIDKVEASSC